MQEVYPMFQYDVQTDADGDRILVIRCPAPNKIMMFPMTVDDANELGGKLAAPSIQIAKPGDTPVA